MDSGGSRRGALVVTLAALVVLAGCSAFASQAGTTTESPTTTTTATETGEITFPEPPETLTPETARETATQYHLALIAQRIDGGGSSTNGSPPTRTQVETTVREGGAGFYASVTLPSDTLEGDLTRYSRVMYLLSEGETPRSAYPIQVRQAETAQVSGPSIEPVSLRLVNFGSNTLGATVVITRISSTSQTAYLETVAVPSRSGLRLEDNIETAGQYRVTITTEDRSDSRIVEISESDTGPPIGIYSHPDGTIEITRGPA